MSSLNDGIKLKYQKCKLKVKIWESEFRKKTGRDPNRNDIKEASSKIKSYYKLYWQLKVKLLETQYLDDKSDTNESKVDNEKDGKTCEETKRTFGSVLKECNRTIHENVNPKGSTLNMSGNNSPVMVNKSNQRDGNTKLTDEVWGSHLNKCTKDKKRSLKSVGSFQIVDKLFKGSSFKKRNPRKSMSFTKTKSNISSSSGNESFVFNFDSDLENTLPANFENVEPNEKFNVHEECSPKVKALITSKEDISPLFNATKIHLSKTHVLGQSVSLIQNILSNQIGKPKSARNLNVGWLQRVNLANNIGSTERLSSDSGFDSSCESLTSPSLNQINPVDTQSDVNHVPPSTELDTNSDDEGDDIIGDSDSENTVDLSNIKANTFSLKRKSHLLEETEKSSTPEINFNDTAEINKRFKLDKDHSVNKPKFFKSMVEEFEESLAEETGMAKPSIKPKKNRLTKKEVLENKIATGTLNDNFVKINIKKKVFVRGKRKFNYSKYKKQQWKNKKNEAGNSESSGCSKCFKCGEIGHFARYCQAIIGDKLLPQDDNCENDEDEDTYPTLEEAEAMAQNAFNKNSLSKRKWLPLIDQVTEKCVSDIIPDPEDNDYVPGSNIVTPFYSLNQDGSVIETPQEVYQTLNKFGHAKFRQGQEEAIMRILSGKSTLVTLATGSGKSLCYQLPAYMYAEKQKCIALVISPLISLMEDQVSNSFSFFKIACLNTNQNEKQREAVMNQLTAGSLHALLVSPEAIVVGEKLNNLKSLIKKLPPIAFACVDEAHCLSQWSHNFRPSYLLICQVLQEKLGIKTILGLTATATKTTIVDITRQLHISDNRGVIQDTPVPNNLILSVSRDSNKDRALLDLLQTAPFSNSQSILIYCTRRDECERLAVLIRTALQDFIKPAKTTNKRLSYAAEAYHAGMSASRRKQVQKAFMSGNLHIVVATVAFGMGINKQEIRAVIHFNMPKNFESYVQEIGRAGRDGMTAHCHLFLDSKGGDLNELRRHIYSDSVDRYVVRKLLQRVFVKCKCVPLDQDGETEVKSVGYCRGHEISFDASETIQALDIPEENICTLLCYLELHHKKWIEVLPTTYTVCKIQSYNGPKYLMSLSNKCAPLAMAIALNRKRGVYDDKSHSITFNVIDVANAMNWNSGTVKNVLKNLEWIKDKNDKWKRSGLVVDFSVLGFHVRARGNMTSSELDDALETLVGRVENQEKTMLQQLNTVFTHLHNVSYPACKNCFEESSLRERSEQLKTVIREYFEKENLDVELIAPDVEIDELAEKKIVADIRTLVCSYRDNNFNGRAVARIFHGIQSPNYPASVWYKCRFWRAHLDKDFNKLSKMATREILRLK